MFDLQRFDSPTFGLISAETKVEIDNAPYQAITQNDKTVNFYKSTDTSISPADTLTMPDDFDLKLKIINPGDADYLEVKIGSDTYEVGALSAPQQVSQKTYTSSSKSIVVTCYEYETPSECAISNINYFGEISTAPKVNWLKRDFSKTDFPDPEPPRTVDIDTVHSEPITVDMGLFLYGLTYSDNYYPAIPITNKVTRRLCSTAESSNKYYQNVYSKKLHQPETPVKMNFNTGKFDYGDWENSLLLKGIRPCMLKSDGTVDYYLDPNDYTKKEDGSPSDVSNSDYDGNAMVEIPTLYFYFDAQMPIVSGNLTKSKTVTLISNKRNYRGFNQLTNSTGEYITAYASNNITSIGQMGNGGWENILGQTEWTAPMHTRADGSVAPYAYIGMFEGAYYSGKLRSLKGCTPMRNYTTEEMITAARNNGTGWYIDKWENHIVIQNLLQLISLSKDSRTTFGIGNAQNSSSASVLRTGTLYNKGMFWGSNENNKAVKVFHIENYWGNVAERTAGLLTKSSMYYYLMNADVSKYSSTSVDNYSRSGETCNFHSGFIDGNSPSYYVQPAQYIGDNWKLGRLKAYFYEVYNSTSGSSSTYCCDYITVATGTGPYYALCGGSASENTDHVGLFRVDLSKTAATKSNYYGARLSYIPPV